MQKIVESHIPDDDNVTKLIENVIKDIKLNIEENIYKNNGSFCDFRYTLQMNQIKNPCSVWFDDSNSFDIHVIYGKTSKEPEALFLTDGYAVSDDKIYNSTIELYLYPDFVDEQTRPGFPGRNPIDILKNKIRHEIEHAYKTMKMEIAGSDSFISLVNSIEALNKFRKEFKPSTIDETKMFNIIYDSIYRLSHHEIDAHVNEFYQDLFRYKEKGLQFSESDINTMPIFVLYQDIFFDFTTYSSMQIFSEVYNKKISIKINSWNEPKNVSMKDIAVSIFGDKCNTVPGFKTKIIDRLEYTIRRLKSAYRYFKRKNVVSEKQLYRLRETCDEDKHKRIYNLIQEGKMAPRIRTEYQIDSTGVQRALDKTRKLFSDK